MVDVPLRHRNGPRKRRQHSPAPAFWTRSLLWLAATIAVVIVIGGLFKVGLDAYHDHLVLTGLSDDPTPVSLAIGSEDLNIPGNMIRFAKTRGGGPVERADLALHWPLLEGYSSALADAFRDGDAAAPVVYASIALRDSPLDSTGRLDEVYARFFVDKPLGGPAGLVGRRLSADSGYEGEVVYFAPSEPRPFVARCIAVSTPEVPATCLRDINFGHGLSLLYRFNLDLLKDWRALDAGMQKLANGFLAH